MGKSKFKIFRGKFKNSGKVEVIREIGKAKYDLKSNILALKINGFFDGNLILEAEEEIESEHDYNLIFEDHENGKNSVIGAGFLLKDNNAGLIQIEIDFLDHSNIFLNLSDNPQ